MDRDVLTPLHDNRLYCCPGESVVINRSVHLARLAASFSACHHCPQAADRSALRPLASGVLDRYTVPEQQGVVRVASGFRGRVGQGLTRQRAMDWAGALATLLWDERLDFGHSLEIGTERTPPAVVIGYDERPGSPEMFTGVARGLERMSCRVLDLGVTTEPCLRFAVQMLQAEAGLLVTGSGCDLAWTGFDVMRRLGLPPEPDFLSCWEQLAASLLPRPSRSPGQLVAVNLKSHDDLAMHRRFHALRPLTVVCAASSRHAVSRMERLLATRSGKTIFEFLPIRRRNLADPQDTDVVRIGQAVVQHSAHLGMIVDEDAAACCFVDERGKFIDATTLQLRMIEQLLRDDPHGTIVLATQVWDQLAPAVTSAGGKPLLVAAADRAARMLTDQGLAAFGDDHRVWLADTLPVCDAVATLAAVLQTLSHSDADASAVFRAAENLKFQI